MSFGRRFPKKILKKALEINYSPLFIEDLKIFLHTLMKEMGVADSVREY